jgi:MOSC domain-containing protein YiiM
MLDPKKMSGAQSAPLIFFGNLIKFLPIKEPFMPQLVSIVYTPTHDYVEPADYYLRVPVTNADLVAGHGLRGDRKGSSPGRGLNVMSAEILADLAGEGFQTGPGQMGEQLVIAGLDFSTLPEGTRLQIGPAGGAVIEYLKNRTGCDRFEHIHSRPRESVAGRLGFMARVVTGGRIKVGDPVTVVVTEAA